MLFLVTFSGLPPPSPRLQILIPPLIHIADVQIKRRLSLMYSITKGYVKSQEDAKFLIKQISGRESIYQVRDKRR